MVMEAVKIVAMVALVYLRHDLRYVDAMVIIFYIHSRL